MAASKQQSSQALRRPTQAVILAGGRGERLRPWTDIQPKPMLEIHGKPFLEYQLELLRDQGITRVLLLLGYLAETVQDYFGNGSRWGLKIEYSVTPVEDNTGRRLKHALPLLDDCFLLLYCDNYWPMRLDKMWQHFLQTGARALLTVYANHDAYTRDTLQVDNEGFIAVYDKLRQAPGLKGTEISYGIFPKELVASLPDENVSFEETLYPVLARHHQLAAFVTHHRYYSVGSAQRLPLTEAFLARRQAIILDRDGVLNRKAPRAEYVRRWDEFNWLPGAKDSLQKLRRAGYRVIVVSNQAGIARGAMTEADLLDIHRCMVREVSQSGGHIDAIYYCPHNWDDGCDCRKPKPGMLFQAQRDFNLDLSRTPFVGDDERDGQAADAAGCPSILVSENNTLLDVVNSLLAQRKPRTQRTRKSEIRISPVLRSTAEGGKSETIIK
jgi:histidinol-phosphate phosphatase family protein